MGMLANSVFTALMGWIRALALEIWNTFSSPEGTTIISWIGAHWKGLAIGLCAAGMGIDLIVYLFRWQPYRIWRSRRAARHRKEETAEASKYKEDENAYLPENMPAEEIPLSAAAAELAPSLMRQAGMVPNEAAEPRPESLPGPETRREGPADRRRSVARYVESSYDGGAEEEIAAARWDAYRPKDRAEGQRERGVPAALSGRGGEDSAPAYEPEPAGRTTEKFEQAIRPRRRRVRNMLMDAQDLETETPDQLIDRNEAYRRPVYPRGWSGKEGDSQ